VGFFWVVLLWGGGGWVGGGGGGWGVGGGVWGGGFFVVVFVGVVCCFVFLFVLCWGVLGGGVGWLFFVFLFVFCGLEGVVVVGCFGCVAWGSLVFVGFWGFFFWGGVWLWDGGGGGVGFGGCFFVGGGSEGWFFFVGFALGWSFGGCFWVFVCWGGCKKEKGKAAGSPLISRDPAQMKRGKEGLMIQIKEKWQGRRSRLSRFERTGSKDWEVTYDPGSALKKRSASN